MRRLSAVASAALVFTALSAGRGADVPPPTVAQLDARQAALLADPDTKSADPSPAKSNEQVAKAAQTQVPEQSPHPETVDIASAAPFPTNAEPSTPDGQLPAIW